MTTTNTITKTTTLNQVLSAIWQKFDASRAEGNLDDYGSSGHCPADAARGEDLEIVLRLAEGAVLATDGGAVHLICDTGGGPCGVRLEIEEVC